MQQMEDIFKRVTTPPPDSGFAFGAGGSGGGAQLLQSQGTPPGEAPPGLSRPASKPKGGVPLWAKIHQGIKAYGLEKYREMSPAARKRLTQSIKQKVLFEANRDKKRGLRAQQSIRFRAQSLVFGTHQTESDVQAPLSTTDLVTTPYQHSLYQKQRLSQSPGLGRPMTAGQS